MSILIYCDSTLLALDGLVGLVGLRKLGMKTHALNSRVISKASVIPTTTLQERVNANSDARAVRTIIGLQELDTNVS